MHSIGEWKYKNYKFLLTTLMLKLVGGESGGDFTNQLMRTMTCPQLNSISVILLYVY